MPKTLDTKESGNCKKLTLRELLVKCYTLDGTRTYENDCDNEECHYSMPLCYRHVALLDGLPCLDDAGLLLLELEQVLDLVLQVSVMPRGSSK